LSNADAERAFSATVDAVRAVINRDGAARLPGFGSFKKKYREGGRQVRNPRTGEMVTTVGRERVAFKPSSNL
jgi:nucleoid DNA-binding protein